MEQINCLNNLDSSITNTKKVYLKRQYNTRIPDASIAEAQKVYIYEQFFSNRNTTTLKRLYSSANRNDYHSKVQSLVKQYILDPNLTIWKYDEQNKDKDSYLEVTIDCFKKDIVYNRIKGKSHHLAKKKRNEYGSDKKTIIEQQQIIKKMEQAKEQYTEVFNRWIEHRQVMMNVLTTYHKCIDSKDMDGMVALKKSLNSDFSIPVQRRSIPVQRRWDSYIFGNLIKDTTQYKKRLKVSYERHVQTQPVYTNATVCTIAEKIAENLSLPQEVDETRTQQAEEEEGRKIADRVSLEHHIITPPVYINATGCTNTEEEEKSRRIAAEESRTGTAANNVARNEEDSHRIPGEFATQPADEEEENRIIRAEEEETNAADFARQQPEAEEVTCSIVQRSEVNECSIIAVKSCRNAEAHEPESQEQPEEDDCIIIDGGSCRSNQAHELESQEQQEKDDCIIIEVGSCSSIQAQELESQDLPATLHSNIIARQQESTDPSRVARHLEFYNMCDQIKHIHYSNVYLLATETASMLFVFQNADEDQLQVPIPDRITTSRKKILHLVRCNYKKYYVDFTETQNEVNKQFIYIIHFLTCYLRI
jgi:hypothetical protein